MKDGCMNEAELPYFSQSKKDLLKIGLNHIKHSFTEPMYKFMWYMNWLPERKDVDFGNVDGNTLVLGLDGIDHGFLRRYDMKRLHSITRDYPTKSWVCDTIPHTAPSWTTIFTGSKPGEHGIYAWYKLQENEEWTTPSNQDKLEKNTRGDIKSLLLWEELEGEGRTVSVHDVPNTLPPLHYNSKAPVNFMPASPSGVYRHNWEEMRWVFENSEKYDVLITVIETPDKINHKVDGKKSMSPFEARRATDELESFLLWCVENFDNWVFLSDHGEPSSFFQIPEYKINISGHRRDGLIVTNMDEPPFLMSDFHDWFLGVLDND